MGFSPGMLSMASSDMNAASSGAPAASTAGTKMDSRPQKKYICSHEGNRKDLNGEQQFLAGIELWSIWLYINAVLTWCGGWADSFQVAEFCNCCLYIRQEAKCLPGAFLHSVHTVGGHQLLQPRPELPSLYTSTGVTQEHTAGL